MLTQFCAVLILLALYLCPVFELGIIRSAHAEEDPDHVTPRSMSDCYNKALLNSRAKCFLDKYLIGENFDSRLLASQCGCCLITALSSAFPDSVEPGGRNVLRCEENPITVYIALAPNNDIQLSGYQAGLIALDGGDACFAQINLTTKFRLPRIVPIEPGGQCNNCHASTTRSDDALEKIEGLTDLAACVPETVNPLLPKVQLTVVTDPAKAYAIFDVQHRCPEEGCTGTFPNGNVVSVIYRPLAGWKVKKITGCDPGGEKGNQCLVTMDHAKTVSATFEENPDTVISLTITKNGAGTGTVTVEPAGTGCGAGCYRYNSPTSVKLTATANAGSKFEQWSMGNQLICEDHTDPCQVFLNAKSAITATFSLTDTLTNTLNVTKAGTGTGKVTGTGINCGDGTPNDCTAPFGLGTTATLMAFPTGGSTVVWSGCTSSSGDTCSVTMASTATAAPKSVTATFGPPKNTLSVIKAGAGTGKVTGSGINCGDGASPSDCTEQFSLSTTLTLTAAPTAGSTVSWTGCNSSTGNSCTLTMPSVATTTPKTVTATFSPGIRLDVQKAGAGTGKVTGTGINCGNETPNDCTDQFALGTTATLTAFPTGSTVSWTGCNTITGNICSLTMPSTATTTPKSVTATFTPAMITLNVTKAGAGTGKVTGTGINCGDGTPNDCTAPFGLGTTATLNAYPSGSSTVSWAGCNTSTGNSCTVTMPSTATTTPKSVMATFNLPPMNTVNVTKAGVGTGKVTATGIDCGDGSPNDCSGQFSVGTTSVILTAVPAGNSTVSWAGCTANGNLCTVSLSAGTPVTKAVTVTFGSPAAIQFNLTLAKAGTGTGTFSASPTAPSCGTNCSKYVAGATVTLTAVPTASNGSVFSHFSGVPCTDGSTTAPITCIFQMPAMPFTQTATFNIPTSSSNLAVAKGGSGTGKIISTPAGINCETQGGGTPSCTHDFVSGSPVTLVATAFAGSSFDHWTGSYCSGSSPTCSFQMAGSGTANAIFLTSGTTSNTLVVSKAGTGSGNVTVSPNGSSCGTNCHSYSSATNVTLSATATSGTFAGWNGSACSGTGSCSVLVSGSKAVTATFNSGSSGTACNLTRSLPFPSGNISFPACKASTLAVTESTSCSGSLVSTSPPSTYSGQTVVGGNRITYYSFTPPTTTGTLNVNFNGGFCSRTGTLTGP